MTDVEVPGHGSQMGNIHQISSHYVHGVLSVNKRPFVHHEDEGEKREKLLALQYSRGEHPHSAVRVGLTKDDFCFGEHCHSYG